MEPAGSPAGKGNLPVSGRRIAGTGEEMPGMSSIEVPGVIYTSSPFVLVEMDKTKGSTRKKKDNVGKSYSYVCFCIA